MPIYEHECEEHGRFEIILQTRSDEEYRACPVCDIPAPLVTPLTVMRPDKYWAGHVTSNYGYVTSGTQLKREMARRNHEVIGDRSDREAWEKIADKAQEAKGEKLKKDVHDWNVRTFGPSGLGLGGADGEKFIRENTKAN